MTFKDNLQYMRHLHNRMTQQELADALGVSRQTVSKWELGHSEPELSRIRDLAALFHVTIDELLDPELRTSEGHHSQIDIVRLPEFRHIPYTVISPEPEDDAITHARMTAKKLGIENPDIIGWDFPNISQEQANVFHMHGYAASIRLDDKNRIDTKSFHVERQPERTYVRITVTDPFAAPFRLIPDAYGALFRYMRVNRIPPLPEHDRFCFEKTYEKDGQVMMDILIAIG
jgi:transcriptional regulator with XRE-family HTH domain